MQFSFLYILLLVTAILTGCTKQTLNLQLTQHTEQKIVGEGFFTDSLKKHIFSFTRTNNLGKENVIYADNVDLSIETPDGTIAFKKIGPGQYEAEEAFRGEYGANYTINFTYEGVVHSAETTMPHPIDTNAFFFENLDESGGLSILGSIAMNVNSPVDQYIKYELFKADIDFLPEDTVWLDTPLPVYRLTRINAGDNIYVNFNIDRNDSFYVRAGDLIKVKVYTISDDIATYLIKLESYLTNELANSQFYNPPYFYTNNAYGLGYGTVVDSVIHQY